MEEVIHGWVTAQTQGHTQGFTLCNCLILKEKLTLSTQACCPLSTTTIF